MWKLSENSDSVKPDALDTVSSRKYVYIRKDFKEVPVLDENGQETGATHWEYMENAVLKSEWENYKETEQNKSDIAYLAMMADVEL